MSKVVLEIVYEQFWMVYYQFRIVYHQSELIYDNLEIVMFNLELLLLVIFLYFTKQTYPMLVDMSFLRFISCCTFSILWGNDDTIESAFSLYSLSNIVTYTRQIILNCKSAILNYQWDILNCQVAILNCQSES